MESPRLKPWEQRKESISVVLQEWENIKVKLHRLFSKREKTAIEPLMKKGTGLLVEMIYWTNGIPAIVDLQEIENLKIKPVNIQERLNYILAYPNKYHSYIQLVELFSETEKLFNKALVMEKRS